MSKLAEFLGERPPLLSSHWQVTNDRPDRAVVRGRDPGREVPGRREEHGQYRERHAPQSLGDSFTTPAADEQSAVEQPEWIHHDRNGHQSHGTDHREKGPRAGPTTVQVRKQGDHHEHGGDHDRIAPGVGREFERRRQTDEDDRRDESGEVTSKPRRRDGDQRNTRETEHHRRKPYRPGFDSEALDTRPDQQRVDHVVVGRVVVAHDDERVRETMRHHGPRLVGAHRDRTLQDPCEQDQ